MHTLLWITRDNGMVSGPHSLAFLRRELDRGSLTLDHLAALDGTEDWMPLETWGREIYPPEKLKIPQQAPYQPKPEGIPASLALTVILGIAGAVYFMLFYDISVPTSEGYVVNLGKMNTRLLGAGISLGTTVIYLLVYLARKK